MILFAEKHFAGKNRRLYVLLLYTAIYLRAFGTLIGSFFKNRSSFAGWSLNLSGFSNAPILLGLVPFL